MAVTGFEGKAVEGNSKALGVNRNQIMSPKRDKLILAALIAEGQQLGRNGLSDKIEALKLRYVR